MSNFGTSYTPLLGLYSAMNLFPTFGSYSNVCPWSSLLVNGPDVKEGKEKVCGVIMLQSLRLWSGQLFYGPSPV